MAALRRLAKELKDMNEKPEDSSNQVFSIAPKGDNLMEWEGFIFGPEGTPYQGGIFKISASFPSTFPYKPPVIKLLTKIYHPNISVNGNICLDLLKDRWSPILTIPKVLMSLVSLLNEPNPDDPLAPEAATLMKTNPREYRRLAQEWTQTYAQL